MALLISQGVPTLFLRRESYERAGLTRAALDERLGLTDAEFRRLWLGEHVDYARRIPGVCEYTIDFVPDAREGARAVGGRRWAVGTCPSRRHPERSEGSHPPECP